MFEKLKHTFSQKLHFTEEELSLIEIYFHSQEISKKELLLENGEVCKFIAFVETGAIRHFHIQDGDEITCDFSFEGSWITDFQSFIQQTPSAMNFQAFENTTLCIVQKDLLFELYKICPKYETYARLVAEQIALYSTQIAMSLASKKPEERFLDLLQKKPELFQRVPQKYIANYLGIRPESLSRIIKRIQQKEKS